MEVFPINKIKFNKFPLSYNINTKRKSLPRDYPDEIITNLFVGSLTHSQSFLQEVMHQKRSYTHGIAVLMCTTLHLDLDIQHQLEKPIIYGNFKKLEIIDSLDEKISDHFLLAFEFIDVALSNGKTVLVHCGAGVSRSPTIVISYLMKKYKLKFEEAFNHVVSKHPDTDPNENFISQLREYESKLEK